MYSNIHKQVQTHIYACAHADEDTQETSPGCGVWPASQKLLTHSKKWEAHSIRGLRGGFYLLIGSQKWMLWENICGRGCSELSCTAWTHGLGLRAEGGRWGGGCSRRGRRGTVRSGGAGLKKAEPGVWWAEWCMFFPLLFSSGPACFLSEDAAICWRWCNECRQGTGSIACLF